MTEDGTPRRPRILLWWAVASCVLVSVGFFAGFLLRGEQRQIADTAVQPVQTTVPVEEHDFSQPVVLTGIFHLGDTVEVPAPAGDGPLIVTRSPLSSGDDVRSGTVLAALSGRPYIALQTDFAFYRDIGPGDSGDDVDELHRSLRALGYGAPASGPYSASTAQALQTLYRDRGFTAPQRTPSDEEADAATSDDETEADDLAAPETYLESDEFYALQTDGTTVVSTARRGEDVSDDGSVVVHLRSGAPHVTARAPMTDIEAIRTLADGDSPVEVTIPGQQTRAQASVHTIGEFTEASEDDDAQPGYPVIFELDGGDDPPAEDGATVTLSADIAGDSPLLAVPSLAVREDAQGPYILTTQQERPPYEETNRCAVTIDRTADGYTAIEPSDACAKTGTAVVVG